MRYSPANEQGLLGLIQALKNGMEPSTALSLYQSIQGDQAGRVAARQERLSGLTGLLQDAATSGLTERQAGMLADIQPGPTGPAVQSILDTLYPTQPMSSPIDSQMGRGGGYIPPVGPAQNVSPLAPKPSPMDQLAQAAQIAEYQQTIAGPQPNATDALGDLGTAITIMQQQGMTPEQILTKIKADPEANGIFMQNYQKIMLAYPELMP